MKYQFKKSTIIISGILSGMLSAGAFAQITEGSGFSGLLKEPSKCVSSSNCPSGAYLVKDGNGETLYNLGTTIGGGQDKAIVSTDGKTIQRFPAKPGVTTEWTNNRYAILIDRNDSSLTSPPTTYTMFGPFKIGYYTQILGVAHNRANIIVSPGINVLNTAGAGGGTAITPGGLNNFWRGLSDITINSTNLHGPDGKPAGALRFAVSQASPIRNVHFIGKKLSLCDSNVDHWACGYTSGGFIGNSEIDGNLSLGSQQQFYITNTKYSDVSGGVWNYVLENSKAPKKPGTNAIPGAWTGFPFTVVSQKSQIPNKPRIIDEKGTWKVDLGDGTTNPVSIDEFAILSPKAPGSVTDVGNDLQEALDQPNNKGVIIMPGVYNFTQSIKIKTGKTVLGIGIPSLVCNSPTGQCMTTDNNNVRIAGVMFDAGTQSVFNNPNNVLLTVGEKEKYQESTPDILQDIYCRIARTNTTMKSPSAYSCITVNADNVVGQNLWLWRGDHDDQSGISSDPKDNLVPWDINQASYGLIVNGDNVTMNGLAVEHFENYQTVWNGKNGKINFYQSEMPYLMPTKGDNPVTCSTPDGSFHQPNQQVCPSLLITQNATGFKGEGLGIYSYFAKHKIPQKIYADSAIFVDAATGVNINHMVDRWLNGEQTSGINNNLILKANGAQEVPYGGAVDSIAKTHALETFTNQLKS